MAAGLIHWYDSEPVKGETRSNQETLDLDTMSRMKMSQLVVVSVILNVRESVLVTLQHKAFATIMCESFAREDQLYCVACFLYLPYFYSSNSFTSKKECCCKRTETWHLTGISP